MAKQIACGHCGGTHGSVAEVRACALGDHPDAPPAPARPAPPPPATFEPASPPATATHPPRTAAELAGPDSLGRSLLLDADDTGPVPAPWADAPVVEADAGVGPDVVERLHRAWRQRERLVIRWAGPLPQEDPVLQLGGPGGVEFWDLDPGTELPGERLGFAVTANTVDARGSTGPDRAGSRFEPLARAAALGARPAISDTAEPSAKPDVRDPDAVGADIVLGDGTPALVDGGPLAPLDAGRPVVPRHHLIAGRLRAQQPAPPPPTAELAADQLAAVAHRGGPARILAPAGSGKTRVLTERTRHLVADWGLHPAAVSLVAYNRRARAEMGQRLTDVPGLEIRTLNSLALALATGRRGGSSARRGLTTISELDTRRLLERLVPGRRRRQLADPLEPWIDALSACRLGLRDPDEVEASYGADVAGFPEVLSRYRAELRRHDALDFDEQILAAIEVLLTDPAARAEARRASPILLVDEFQDLTPAHLLLVRLLAGPAAEVYAVGDDDQTIYGYTGASPRWLVDFERWFPGAADHRLTVNYRCPPAVVAAASSLLTHNRYRVTKEIEPAPGRPLVAGELTVADGTDPQAALVARVGELLAAGAGPGDIAVLARVNAALLPAALHLAAAGHPVARPPGLDHRMLERSGMAAALAWLRLASTTGDGDGAGFSGEDLRLALRRPPRSLHPRIADWVCEQRSVERLLNLAERLTSERDATTVNDLAADLSRLQTLASRGASAGQLLDVVYRDIGLLGAVSQLDQSQRTARRAAHADELNALRAVADLAPGPAELEPWIRAHLHHLPVAGTGDPDGEAPADSRITLATIHATKGLEWPHVIVHDVRDELYPHRLAVDLEEERRVFHVAITRGRASVLVNTAPPGPDAAPSPFVAELHRARPADQAWPDDQPALVRSAGAPKGSSSGGGTGGSATSGGRAARPEPADGAEAARRTSLTEWRLTRSKADGHPAYVVLDNATLDAIAAANPSSLAALGRIKGIGPAKLDRYGADILGVLAG